MPKETWKFLPQYALHATCMMYVTLYSCLLSRGAGVVYEVHLNRWVRSDNEKF